MCHQRDGLLIMLKHGSFIHAFCAFRSLSCSPCGSGHLALVSYRPLLQLKQAKDIQLAHHHGRYCGICFMQGGVLERSLIDCEEDVHAYCQAKRNGATIGESEQIELVQTLLDDATL
jgi:hypothetical protein